MPYKINKSPYDDMQSSWLRFGVNNREQSNANTAVPPVNTCKLALALQLSVNRKQAFL